jgi:hypothetical protein
MDDERRERRESTHEEGRGRVFGEGRVSGQPLNRVPPRSEWHIILSIKSGESQRLNSALSEDKRESCLAARRNVLTSRSGGIEERRGFQFYH